MTQTMYANAVGASELLGFAQFGMAKPKKEKKEKPIGVRPTESQLAKLTTAQQATGADITELIMACVEKCLPAVVKEISDHRRKAEAAFFQKPGNTNEHNKG